MQKPQSAAQLFDDATLARSIVDASPVPSAVNDNAGNITYLNAAFTHTFGYTPDELKTLEDWWPKAYPDPAYRQWVRVTWQEYLSDSRETGLPFKPIELDVRCKSGETKTIMASATPLEGTDAAAGLHLVKLYDISERKALELALRTSEETLQRAQAVARIGSFTMGSDTRYSIHSKETARLFDLDTPGEKNFGEWFSRVHPDDQVAVKTAWHKALHGAPYDITYRIVVQRGIIWIRALAELEFDAQGQLKKAVGTVQDVTDIKLTEAVLQESKQQLELAIEGAELGMWIWDIPKGHVIFNERWCSMLGYQRNEVAPYVSSWRDLVHPDDWPVINAALEPHLKGQTASYESEHRMRHKDGHWVWMLDRGKVVERSPDGEPLRAAGIHQDISARKQLRLEGTELLRKIESMILQLNAPQQAITAAPRDPRAEAEQRLTRRQIEILRLIAMGKTSAQIAQSLNISRETAIGHRREIMRRLERHSVAELTRYAIEHRLLEN